MSGERQGWRKDFFIGSHILPAHGTECSTGSRCDCIKDTEERIRVAILIPGDEVGKVEIVTSIHSHTIRQFISQKNFLLGIQQGDFNSIHFIDV